MISVARWFSGSREGKKKQNFKKVGSATQINTELNFKIK